MHRQKLWSCKPFAAYPLPRYTGKQLVSLVSCTSPWGTVSALVKACSGACFLRDSLRKIGFPETVSTDFHPPTTLLSVLPSTTSAWVHAMSSTRYPAKLGHYQPYRPMLSHKCRFTSCIPCRDMSCVHDPNNEGTFHFNACKMDATPCHACNVHAILAATVMPCMQQSWHACSIHVRHALVNHVTHADFMPCKQQPWHACNSHATHANFSWLHLKHAYTIPCLQAGISLCMHHRPNEHSLWANGWLCFGTLASRTSNKIFVLPCGQASTQGRQPYMQWLYMLGTFTWASRYRPINSARNCMPRFCWHQPCVQSWSKCPKRAHFEIALVCGLLPLFCGW